MKKKIARLDELRPVQNTAFATHNKLPLGPGDHDPSHVLVKSKSPECNLITKNYGKEIATDQAQKAVQLFDGHGATIKDRRRVTDGLMTTAELAPVPEFD